MRIYQLIMLFILFFSQLIFAQNYQESTQSEIDSLNKALNNFIEINDTLNTCRVYYKLGKKYDVIGDAQKSNDMLLKGLQLANDLKNTKAIALISNSLASIYSDRGESQKSIQLYEKTFQLFTELKDSTNMANILMNIGTEYVSTGEYQKAIETELQALDLRLACGDSSNIAYYFQSLTEIYYAIEDFDNWEKYLFFANQLAQIDKYADFFTRCKIMNELGEYYSRRNETDKAISTYEHLYKMSENSDYLRGMSIALSNMSPLLIKKSDFRKAIYSSKKALELHRKMDNLSGIIYDLIQVGSLYRKINNPVQAEKYLNEGLSIAIKNSNLEDQVNANKELYLLYKKTGASKKALVSYENYTVLKDSIINSETKKHIVELHEKFNHEKKEQQIELLNKENEIQKSRLVLMYQFIGAGSFSFILLFILGYFYTRHKRVKLEFYALQAEHKMLLSQLNPHFLFNSLMAIQNFLIKNDSLQTYDYLADFARLMRLILESSREGQIELSKEIEIINYYLKMQKLRFSNRFNYSIEYDESLLEENISLPPMLAQPVIENAVEHGVSNLPEGEGKIKVVFTKTDSKLSLVIQDNGPGFMEENVETKSHKSYAVKIIHERIENLAKLNSKKITMNISSLDEDSLNKGTRVEFLIPVTG